MVRILKNLKIGKKMAELLFFMVFVLIYLYSFLYRNISILATVMTVLLASYVNANLYLILVMVLVLGVIRINKSGIKDEY